jgi:hypothetical protein
MDALALKAAAEETLDPDDWAAVQVLSHQIVDDAVGYLRDVRDRPVDEAAHLGDRNEIAQMTELHPIHLYF